MIYVLLPLIFILYAVSLPTGKPQYIYITVWFVNDTIAGDIQENVFNIEKCFQIIKQDLYDKQNLWNSFAKKPVVICLVRWTTDDEGIIDSRICQVCVVCISGHKQDEIDNEEIKSDHDVQSKSGWTPIQIDTTQFVTEEHHINQTIQIYNKRRDDVWKDSWQQAWDEIKKFDSKYNRTKDNGYMSEQERLGNFNSNGMCIVSESKSIKTTNTN